MWNHYVFFLYNLTKNIQRNAHLACLVTEHLLVKMAAGSQHPGFTVNEIVKCGGKICLITNISNKLCHNRYTTVNIDTEEKIVAFGFQLQQCDEINAVLLPEVDVFHDEDDMGESAATEAAVNKPSAVGTDGNM